MKWTPGQFEKGDIIRIKTGSFYHYGIFVSEDEVIQFGYPPLPEYADKNDPPVVCAVDIDVFCSGRIAERAVYDRKERKTARKPDETVSVARKRMGEGGYNILHNNCEHFVTGVVFGVPRCEQEEKVRKKWKEAHGKN